MKRKRKKEVKYNILLKFGPDDTQSLSCDKVCYIKILLSQDPLNLGFIIHKELRLKKKVTNNEFQISFWVTCHWLIKSNLMKQKAFSFMQKPIELDSYLVTR